MSLEVVIAVPSYWSPQGHQHSILPARNYITCVIIVGYELLAFKKRYTVFNEAFFIGSALQRETYQKGACITTNNGSSADPNLKGERR